MKIPEKYFALVKKYSNSDDSWVADKDQFGNPIETELNIFYKTEKQIIKHSKELVEDFPAEEAEDGADCQFCMDFSVGEEPRIIFWDDAELTWRVIANTIEDFIIRKTKCTNLQNEMYIFWQRLNGAKVIKNTDMRYSYPCFFVPIHII